MGKYKINTPTETDNSHIVRGMMIGAPLVLVLVFSFGFVLVRPFPTDYARSAAANKTPETTGKDTDFAPASKAPTTLPPLTQLPVSNNGTESAAAARANSMAAPQTTGSSGRSSASPQTSAASGQSIDPTRSIPVNANLPAPALTNLLR